MDTERSLRNVLGYRLYYDLRRGWRITSPNLEQCGLLEIGYISPGRALRLTESRHGKDKHPSLGIGQSRVIRSPQRALHVLTGLSSRRSLAIKVGFPSMKTPITESNTREQPATREPLGYRRDEKLEQMARFPPTPASQ